MVAEILQLMIIKMAASHTSPWIFLNWIFQQLICRLWYE